MFYRIKSYRNKDGSQRQYISLVATKRIEGQIRQVTVAHLGRVEQVAELMPDLVKKLGHFTNKLAVIDGSKGLKNDWVKEYGPVVIFSRLWQQLGLERYLGKYLKRRRIVFDASQAIFAMALNRLLEPKSELATHGWAKGLYGLRAVDDLNCWYRALDVLMEHKDHIEQELFVSQRDLFNDEIDVVLMDTTSVVYWGEGTGADGLLAYGYSKQKRFDLKQVIVGILMTKDGVPIGHEIYPGNTNDIRAFEAMMQAVAERFHIRRVVIVCDRGMVSERNLKLLEQAGYEYVVGVRMRQLKQHDARRLLEKAKMRSVSPQLKGREVPFEGKRLVVCFNAEQAEKDKQKRQEIIGRLVEKLKTQGLKSLLFRKEYSKYIKIKADKPQLNEEKIRAEEKFDGKFVLQTNTALHWKEVVRAYKDLWQVEAAFRALKNELAMGPIYHSAERRIRAHIFICFLALVLRINLQKKLTDIDRTLSFSKVIDDLKKIKAVKVSLQTTPYILRTELTGDACYAFKAVGLKIPPRLLNDPPPKETIVVPHL